MERGGTIDNLDKGLRGLDRWGDARCWVGSDPYEGLNAGLSSSLRRPLAERMLIQAVKRAPFDLRPLLGIRSRPSAPAFAQVLGASLRMMELDVLSEQAATRRAAFLIGQLADLRTTGHRGFAWGYPFDVRTRFFRYSASTPNTIATSFAGLALLDAHALTGSAAALEYAIGAGEFFLHEVPQTQGSDGAYFGYLPGDRTPVHNANLLASAFLAALSVRTGSERFRAAAERGIAYGIAHQHPDGSWPYADDARGKWVDGLHTGYVLDALLISDAALDITGARTAHARGLGFYADRLIDSDGAPRALTNSRYPIDAQYAAQAIRTFSLASRIDPVWLRQAVKIQHFAVRRLRRRDGAFVFQRHRLWTNRIPHVRWVQAPMFDALALLLEAQRGAGRPGLPRPPGLALQQSIDAPDRTQA